MANSRRDWTMTIDLAVRQWAPRINEAATACEARWSRMALRNWNPKYADGLELAIAQYETAVSSGTSTEIINAGQRLVKGYNVLSAQMGAANVPDDAYMIGQSGDVQIIIAASPAAAARAREHYRFAPSYTPDEIATILALDERARKISAVKAAFPGAQITEINHVDTDQEEA